MPRNQHKITARQPARRQNLFRQSTQTAARTITHHRIPHFSRGCQPVTKARPIPSFAMMRQILYNNPGGDPPSPFGRHGEKIGSPEQMLQPAHVTRPESGRKTLTTLGTTAGQNATSTTGFHARTEAMTTLSNEFAWLISPLHGYSPSLIKHVQARFIRTFCPQSQVSANFFRPVAIFRCFLTAKFIDTTGKTVKTGFHFLQDCV